MVRRCQLTTSTERRHQFALRVSQAPLRMMRKCSHCLADGVECTVSRLHESCGNCVRLTRKCELASPWAEVDKLQQEDERLSEKIVEAEAKAARLRKQRRVTRRKLKMLGDREYKNILEMETDEAVSAAVTGVFNPDPNPLSPTGFSQVSFGDLLGRTPEPVQSNQSGMISAPTCYFRVPNLSI
jgi:hypothetical protein